MSQLLRPNWPQNLLDLLQRQHEMVNRLVNLAQVQAALIADRRTDRLLDLLAQRQMLIDEFTASQVDLTQLTQGLDQRLESALPEQRERIHSLINEIGQRLTQVMHRDEQDQAALRTNRDAVKHELSSMGTARQARTAYRGAPVGTNRFADRRG